MQLTLDEKGHGEVTTASQWQDSHSPLQVVLQASLLESGGRPVTRTVQQPIWPAEALPGIRPQFTLKDVYDYRTDTTVKQPVVDETVTPLLTSSMLMPEARKSGLRAAGAADPRAARLLLELVR